MDLTLDAAIDTACDCGESAAGYVFAPDGTRRYVCGDCAAAIDRHLDDRTLDDLPDAPRARRCRTCEQVTLLDAMNVRGVCVDCRTGAGG
jgi:hypothetical protein